MLKNTIKILALDIATVTGFATDTSSGFWNLAPKKGESKGAKLLKFKKEIRDIIELEQIQLVVFERCAGQHKAAIISQAELQGILIAFCEENNIEYSQVSAKEIKSHATGNGNANKAKMVQAAKEKLNFQGDNDNEADALWILHLANSQYN